MTTILGIIAVCVLVGLALVVAVCFGSKYIEGETRVLPPECETQTTPTQKVKKKSWLEQYQEECWQKAVKLVASDIEHFLLPLLIELQEKMVDGVLLEIEDRELCLLESEFDYDCRHKIPTSISQDFYWHELERQLNEMGFVAECFIVETLGREYMTVYLDEY